MTQPHPDTPQPDAAPGVAPPQVDHAWKLLTMTNEWIRHADAKATAALAFIAALSALLYNLVAKQPETTASVNCLTIVGCILLVLATIGSGLTLIPRIDDKSGSPSTESKLIYFKTIDGTYKNRRQDYVDELQVLISSPQNLTKGLAEQIHVNAQIATIKSRCAQWSVGFLLGAGVCVAWVASLVAE